MFSDHRQRLIRQLPAGAAALLTANDVMPTNADGTMPYYPNVNVYYLTGLSEEDAMLALFPSHPDPSLREILFIKRVDQMFVKWMGRRVDKTTASNISGIRTVFYTDEFWAVMKKVLPLCNSIYLHTNEHARSENETQTREDRLLLACKQYYPLHRYERLYPILARQRNAKTPAEIALIRKASEITERGFRRVLQSIRPGQTGMQVAAEMIHEYMQHGATWAYEPIVAFGADSTILHLRANESIGKDGDIVLIDAAAQYRCYNTDLTRTFPVNGRFTPRQKAYYNAVLRVHKKVAQEVKAGILIKDLWKISNNLLLEELVGLGLCTIADIQTHGAQYYLNKHCYHNVSHFLGLDVHDTGYYDEPMPEGAVINNEPGIYNEEEGIGVRIENDLLVTENGFEDLMKTIPKEAEEIEEIMNS